MLNHRNFCSWGNCENGRFSLEKSAFRKNKGYYVALVSWIRTLLQIMQNLFKNVSSVCWSKYEKFVLWFFIFVIFCCDFEVEANEIWISWFALDFLFLWFLSFIYMISQFSVICILLLFLICSTLWFQGCFVYSEFIMVTNFPEVIFPCQHRIKFRSINNLKKLLTKYVIKCMYLNGGVISKSSHPWNLMFNENLSLF